MHKKGVRAIIEQHAKIMWPDENWTREAAIEDAEALFFPVLPEERPQWIHAAPTELMRGPERVFSGEVANAAQTYLLMPWLRNEALDWLFADALAFQEINSTVRTLSPSVTYGKDGQPIIWLFILKGLIKLLIWGVWLCAVVFVYDGYPAVALALVALTFAYQLVKRSKSKRLAELLQSMVDVYGALDSVPPSWRNLYALMERSREKGAKWPTPLYRLVERNLA